MSDAQIAAFCTEQGLGTMGAIRGGGRGGATPQSAAGGGGSDKYSKSNIFMALITQRFWGDVYLSRLRAGALLGTFHVYVKGMRGLVRGVQRGGLRYLRLRGSSNVLQLNASCLICSDFHQQRLVRLGGLMEV